MISGFFTAHTTSIFTTTKGVRFTLIKCWTDLLVCSESDKVLTPTTFDNYRSNSFSGCDFLLLLFVILGKLWSVSQYLHFHVLFSVFSMEIPIVCMCVSRIVCKQKTFFLSVVLFRKLLTTETDLKQNITDNYAVECGFEINFKWRWSRERERREIEKKRREQRTKARERRRMRCTETTNAA